MNMSNKILEKIQSHYISLQKILIKKGLDIISNPNKIILTVELEKNIKNIIRFNVDIPSNEEIPSNEQCIKILHANIGKYLSIKELFKEIEIEKMFCPDITSYKQIIDNLFKLINDEKNGENIRDQLFKESELEKKEDFNNYIKLAENYYNKSKEEILTVCENMMRMKFRLIYDNEHKFQIENIKQKIIVKACNEVVIEILYKYFGSYIIEQKINVDNNLLTTKSILTNISKIYNNNNLTISFFNNNIILNQLSMFGNIPSMKFIINKLLTKNVYLDNITSIIIPKIDFDEKFKEIINKNENFSKKKLFLNPININYFNYLNFNDDDNDPNNLILISIYYYEYISNKLNKNENDEQVEPNDKIKIKINDDINSYFLKTYNIYIGTFANMMPRKLFIIKDNNIIGINNEYKTYMINEIKQESIIYKPIDYKFNENLNLVDNEKKLISRFIENENDEIVLNEYKDMSNKTIEILKTLNLYQELIKFIDKNFMLRERLINILNQGTTIKNILEHQSLLEFIKKLYEIDEFKNKLSNDEVINILNELIKSEINIIKLKYKIFRDVLFENNITEISDVIMEVNINQIKLLILDLLTLFLTISDQEEKTNLIKEFNTYTTIVFIINSKELKTVNYLDIKNECIDNIDNDNVFQSLILKYMYTFKHLRSSENESKDRIYCSLHSPLSLLENILDKYIMENSINKRYAYLYALVNRLNSIIKYKYDKRIIISENIYFDISTLDNNFYTINNSVTKDDMSFYKKILSGYNLPISIYSDDKISDLYSNEYVTKIICELSDKLLFQYIISPNKKYIIYEIKYIIQSILDMFAYIQNEEKILLFEKFQYFNIYLKINNIDNIYNWLFDKNTYKYYLNYFTNK
jgi:hypothetical protein